MDIMDRSAMPALSGPTAAAPEPAAVLDAAAPEPAAVLDAGGLAACFAAGGIVERWVR